MRIYNSLTRTKDEFIPIKDNEIGMYVCGPTVYDEPHIGHARSAYIFDVVRRYFAYKGYDVKFVRNVTDVDDKIIGKARERVGGKGQSLAATHDSRRLGMKSLSKISEVSLIDATKEISKKYLAAYHRDMELLGIGAPNFEPKATEYIPKMITYIERLIKNGCAYESAGDVYFDIKKAKGYGKLSNQNIEKMEAGARIANGEKKRDPLDFALWKKVKEDEPSWESPWGKGRPGWHIECSVMSSDILGGEFDIHGGGIDLIFPHHENEIAQSEGAGDKFARCWMHNGLLTINSTKMAKSLGNFISIQDFIAKYHDSDYLKLLFLNTHYRHPVDYTDGKIGEMKRQKERVVILSEKIRRVKGQSLAAPSDSQRLGMKFSSKISEYRVKFEEAMDDDFNTPLALASLFDLVACANKLMKDKDVFSDEEKTILSGMKELLTELGSVLGLDLSKTVAGDDISEKEVLALIEKRSEARKTKDFKKADEVRRELSDKYNVILEDAKDGTIWRRKA